MGTSQSKPSPSDTQQRQRADELSQLVLERVRALNLDTDRQSRQRSRNEHAVQSFDTKTGDEFVLIEKRGHDDDKAVSTCARVARTSSKVVSIGAVEQWERELLSDPKNRLALSALSSNAATSILSSRAALVHDTQTFNVRIPAEGAPVTNQRASGRCWLFASTNVFRIALMKRHDLKELELSQAYLFFWDKLEKANYFLESVLDTVKEPLDGRLLHALMASPVGDGGQWDMVANLVAKYGLVSFFFSGLSVVTSASFFCFIPPHHDDGSID